MVVNASDLRRLQYHVDVCSRVRDDSDVSVDRTVSSAMSDVYGVTVTGRKVLKGHHSIRGGLSRRSVLATEKFNVRIFEQVAPIVANSYFQVTRKWGNARSRWNPSIHR